MDLDMLIGCLVLLPPQRAGWDYKLGLCQTVSAGGPGVSFLFLFNNFSVACTESKFVLMTAESLDA